jgi:ankyrin repeat protein
MRWAVSILVISFLGTANAASPLFEAIRKDDVAAVEAMLKAGADPNSRDDQDATALMHATLYASERCMKALADQGADVNAAAKGGSTALMWATGEPIKVRFLLARGADRNAKNKMGMTALDLALIREEGEAAAKLLAAPGQMLRRSDAYGADKLDLPLFEGDGEALAELKAHGWTLAAMRQLGVAPLWFGAFRGDGGMVDRLLDAGADPNKRVQYVTLALPPVGLAAYSKNLDGVRILIEKGADVNAKGSGGHTPLMLAAAAADAPSKAVVELLLSRGADPNLSDNEGYTALDWALLQGESDITALLRQRGAKPGGPHPAPKPRAKPQGARQAATQAVALLQPASPKFFSKTGCISCHNQSLVAMAVTTVRGKGVAIDESLAAHPTKSTVAVWSPERENFQQGIGSVGGWIANVSYGLAGMAAEGAPYSVVTDAAALCLARYQRPDGSWTITDVRPPLGNGAIKWTALVIRGAGAYMPPGRHEEWEGRVARAAAFLRKAPSHGTQDDAFRILGLKWAGAPAVELSKLARQIVAAQKPDGGWPQLPAMKSDAYATGQALYALNYGAGMAASQEAYRRGVDFLLRTQLEDGSWYVRRRGFAFQPYVDYGFPHGRDQFISAAATSWAVIGLSPAVR